MQLLVRASSDEIAGERYTGTRRTRLIQFVKWNPYTGNEALILTGILAVIGVVLLVLGMRMREPIGVLRPGRTVAVLLILIWLLAVTVFLLAAAMYVQAQPRLQRPVQIPSNPITTLAVLITFMLIIILAQRHGFLKAVGSAMVGTIAGPMIFELPFDLIVIGKAQSPEPAAPYVLLYFLPLFLVEITTFALLTLSPLTRLTRYTLVALAAMFFALAGWAYFGFPYPSSAMPIALSSATKVLAFVAAITLFLPERH